MGYFWNFDDGSFSTAVNPKHVFDGFGTKNVKFIPTKDRLLEADYDFHIPIGSLGKFFRGSIKAFNNHPSGYLKSRTDLNKTQITGGNSEGGNLDATQLFGSQAAPAGEAFGKPKDLNRTFIQTEEGSADGSEG